MQLPKKYSVIITIAFIIALLFIIKDRIEINHQRAEFQKIMSNYQLVIKKQQAIINGLDQLSGNIRGIVGKVNNVSNGLGEVNQNIDGAVNLIADAKNAAAESAELLEEQQALFEEIQKKQNKGDERKPERGE